MEGGGDGRKEEERRRAAVREMQITIGSASVFPGFRFSPTDEELIMYYLKKKMEGCDDKCVEIIPEVDFCRHEPWDLPRTSIIESDNEWFFFCARGRKYPNGSQSRRATESGYWKATGKERNVKSGSNVIGTKRTLVFHTGRAPKGERTEWIMHEYCMDGTSQDSMVVCRLRRNSDFHLNENPRRSQGRRHLSDGQNSGFALSDGIPQRNTLDAGDNNFSKVSKANGDGDDSCSKECTGSNNYQSVEQNNFESESNQRQTDNKFCDGDGEEEWFADILKDDIVKLDESCLCTRQRDGPAKQSTISHSPPCQGTADRRIRLRKQRVIIKHVKSFEADKGGTDMVDTVMKHCSCSVSLLLVLLTFFVMFLSWLGGVKRFPLVCRYNG